MDGYIILKTETSDSLSEDEQLIVEELDKLGLTDLTQYINDSCKPIKYIEENLRSNPALGSILGSNLAGNAKLLRNEDAFCGENVFYILERWYDYLKDKIVDSHLLDFESTMKDKVGPLSYRVPLIDRIPSIVKYWTDPAKSIGREIDSDEEKAIQLVVKEFIKLKGNVRGKDLSKTLEDMEKSTSAGYPSMKKKRDLILSKGRTNHIKIVSSTSNESISSIRNLFNIWNAQRINFETSNGDIEIYLSEPAILGWRGQEGGPKTTDQKQRVVWMFPMTTSVLELSVYQPLIKSVQQHNLIPGYMGQDDVDLCMTRLFNTKGQDDYVICTDFSTFDTHFGRRCQFIVSILLRKILTNFNESNSLFLNYGIFRNKFQIPMLISPHILLVGEHGMGSGSGGTNFDETLFHRFLQHLVALKAGQQLNLNSQCLGDDGLLTFPNINLDDILDTYTSYGLEMQESKQTVDTDWCIYLKRYYHKDYKIDGVNRGVYSTCRAIGKLYFRERLHKEWTKKDDILRNLSILENCCYHPLFDDFVDFLINLNPDIFGLGEGKEFRDILNLDTKAEVNKLAMSYVQQQSFDGSIRDWHIVRKLSTYL